MNLLVSTKTFCTVLSLILLFEFILASQVLAEQRRRTPTRPRATPRVSRGVKVPPSAPASSLRPGPPAARGAVPIPAPAPLPVNINPFASLESTTAADKRYILDFSRTQFDNKAEASAEVVMHGQTLLVRMRAENLPVPSHFGVPRYSLWAYLPSHHVKFCLGDLPITPRSRSVETFIFPRKFNRTQQSGVVVRGESESAYRYTVLPPGAVFGGLILTAEPLRYTPIINEPLQPVLVAMTSPQNTNYINARAIYAGPLIPVIKQTRSGKYIRKSTNKRLRSRR